jgi:hypothetical protein
MSLEAAAANLRDCHHGAAIVYAEDVKRCPHCGAMFVRRGGWAQPHLVAELVRALPTTETK